MKCCNMETRDEANRNQLSGGVASLGFFGAISTAECPCRSRPGPPLALLALQPACGGGLNKDKQATRRPCCHMINPCLLPDSCLRHLHFRQQNVGAPGSRRLHTKLVGLNFSAPFLPFFLLRTCARKTFVATACNPQSAQPTLLLATKARHPQLRIDYRPFHQQPKLDPQPEPRQQPEQQLSATRASCFLLPATVAASSTPGPASRSSTEFPSWFHSAHASLIESLATPKKFRPVIPGPDVEKISPV